ncbi:hypothetical protein A9Q98_14300 [Thalassotalea sp. 42_200_T64]|nr:hypothetical protein A9Q98_14300 [Thalassotalea sp. 42_200_T64]
MKYINEIKFIGVFLLISAAIALIFKFSGVIDQFDQRWIEQSIHDKGQAGLLYFIAVIALATSLGLPRQVAAFAAGYAFGVWQGVFVATFSAALGCCLSFSFARFIARPMVLKHLNDKVEIFNHFLQHNTFQKTFIIRLMPAGNNFLLNLAAGVGNINAFRFISGSYVGYFPQMAIFALAGSGVHVMSYWQIGASAILSIIAMLLSLRLYRQYQSVLRVSV